MSETTEIENPVYVLWWRYSDGSAAGVIKVFENEQTAKEQLDILIRHGDGLKKFDITPVPYSDN